MRKLASGSDTVDLSAGVDIPLNGTTAYYTNSYTTKGNRIRVIANFPAVTAAATFTYEIKVGGSAALARELIELSGSFVTNNVLTKWQSPEIILGLFNDVWDTLEIKFTSSEGADSSVAVTTEVWDVDEITVGNVLLQTTIATLASQTSFTLTIGSGDNDSYNGCVAVVEDATNSTQKAMGIIGDYASDKTVTLAVDPGIFTMAAGDYITILAKIGDRTSGDLDVNVAQWLGSAVTLSTGSKPDVNVDEISDDATAPDNLELAYDGTGYAGGTTLTNVNASKVGGNTPTVHIANSGTVTTNAVANTFVISAGSSVNDHYNGHLITIYDDSASTYQTRVISDYVGSSKTVVLRDDLTFTTQGTVDTFRIWAQSFADPAIAGGSANTYIVTDDGTSEGEKIPDVHVWVTQDAGGNTILASGTTDSDGEVVFYLDAGNTYYIWKSKSGYTFADQPETVTAT